jgi:hypothetical protein
MKGMPITMLNGFGCAQCGGTCNKPAVMGLRGLGAVADYDQIKIGGRTYTVNQLIGKSVRAYKDTPVYSGNKGTPKVVGTVKNGEIIGVVASYARPEQANGKSWLMFEKGYNVVYWVPNEAVTDAGLDQQGTKTVTDELKAEADKKLKDESPIEYYIKKYALKVGLAIGVVIIVNSLVKEGVRAAASKKSTTATT